MHEGPKDVAAAPLMVDHGLSPSGLVNRLDAGNGREVLSGEVMQGLLVEDLADSWGMEEWRYRNVLGTFTPVPGSFVTLEHGRVRRVTEAEYACGNSRLLCRTIAYAEFPFLEFRFRVYWNEERKRLKLSIPTVFRSSVAYCEVPGGAIARPGDGEEHVQGRWMVLSGDIGGRPTALGIVNSGQHGFDLKDGEVRLSVLRSPLYCHERSFPLTAPGHKKAMDQGVHEFRVLLTAGDTAEILRSVSGLADWLAAPPYALAHYPIGERTPARREILAIEPPGVRLVACKRSWDGTALILRLQEAIGEGTEGTLRLAQPAATIHLAFRPFEIKTLRFERDGAWAEVPMIEEHPVSEPK